MDGALDMALDDGGRIWVCGFTLQPNLDRFNSCSFDGWPLPVLWRLRPDGSLDPDFNRYGQAAFFEGAGIRKGGEPQDIRASVALDPGTGAWMVVEGLAVERWKDGGNTALLKVNPGM
jgi:hypothetical protein